MDLIQQLKEDHVKIIHLFEGVNAGITDEKTEAQELMGDLRNLKETLITHLDLEDKMLYPKLVGSNQKEAGEAGEKFSGEMVKITNTVLAFFGKYILVEATELKNNAEFEKELSGIIEVVVKRVETEENILFPAYEKFCE